MEEKETFSLEECQDRGHYILVSRNLMHGIFIKEERSFVGIRQKFNGELLDTEYHWDVGAPYGTATPIKYLGQIDPKLSLTDKKKLLAWLKAKDEIVVRDRTRTITKRYGK